MTPVIALSVLVTYLLVSAEVFLATAVGRPFRISAFGVGPTELRILLAIGTIALAGDPHVDLGAFGRMRLFDFGGLAAAAGMIVALATSAVRNGVELSRLEPRPRPPAPEPQPADNHIVKAAAYSLRLDDLRGQ
jgi:hypothetical protein